MSKKAVQKVYPDAVVHQDGNLWGCSENEEKAPFAYGTTTKEAWASAAAQLAEHIKRVPDTEE